MTDPGAKIAARRRELEAERASIRSRLDELDSELSELETTERVLARLLGGADKFVLRLNPRPVPLDRRSDDEISRGKPEGTPTIPEMILESLELALRLKSPGLEPNGMLSFVRGRYWPEAKSSDISSIAWRMWKRGQLIKEGSLYRLPPRNEAEGASGQEASPSASITGVVSDASDQPSPGSRSGEPEGQVAHEKTLTVFD